MLETNAKNVDGVVLDGQVKDVEEDRRQWGLVFAGGIGQVVVVIGVVAVVVVDV